MGFFLFFFFPLFTWTFYITACLASNLTGMSAFGPGYAVKTISYKENDPEEQKYMYKISDSRYGWYYTLQISNGFSYWFSVFFSSKSLPFTIHRSMNGKIKTHFLSLKTSRNCIASQTQDRIQALYPERGSNPYDIAA